MLCFVMFIFNKVYIRELLLQGELSPSLEKISYSIPNFFEAVMGTSILVAILLTLKFKNIIYIERVSDLVLKSLGIGFSYIFVITQELKIHNLGGNNVYDINDLIASIIGMFFIAFIIFRYGIVNYEQIQT